MSAFRTSRFCAQVRTTGPLKNSAPWEHSEENLQHADALVIQIEFSPTHRTALAGTLGQVWRVLRMGMRDVAMSLPVPRNIGFHSSEFPPEYAAMPRTGRRMNALWDKRNDPMRCAAFGFLPGSLRDSLALIGLCRLALSSAHALSRDPAAAGLQVRGRQGCDTGRLCLRPRLRVLLWLARHPASARASELAR
jgi:hypothetical protein